MPAARAHSPDEIFSRDYPDGPAVRGFLERPKVEPVCGLVLAHGAGLNAEAPLLSAVSRALQAFGVAVLRIDLPFRQERPKGPPWPAAAAADREGLRRAAAALRELISVEIWIGGHSYGGRQASMLAAESPETAAGLLLLSYPLHPPNRPEQKRTAHLPSLTVPALFVQGASDPFGSLEEVREAAALIPGRHDIHIIESAGHDLTPRGRRRPEIAAEIADAFAVFAGLIPAEAVELPIEDVFDLHSVPPGEVQAVVEAYLEEAHRRGLKALRIIHGRGIGVQRETVRAVLSRTPSVESFSDAPAEAGGWGATVVTLH